MNTTHILITVHALVTTLGIPLLLILAVGGIYTLWHFGYLKDFFGGKDDDNW